MPTCITRLWATIFAPNLLRVCTIRCKQSTQICDIEFFIFFFVYLCCCCWSQWVMRAQHLCHLIHRLFRSDNRNKLVAASAPSGWNVQVRRDGARFEWRDKERLLFMLRVQNLFLSFYFRRVRCFPVGCRVPSEVHIICTYVCVYFHRLASRKANWRSGNN